MNSDTRTGRRARRHPLRIGTSAVIAALLLGVAAKAVALPIEDSAGAGPDTASVVLEFLDGSSFVFEVLFDEAIATSGLDLMQTLADELPSFDIVVLDFGFGLFIDEISYDTHVNGGFGGGDLFWHYWTKEQELAPWAFSPVGAVDRPVTDGDWDAWKYGGGKPIPEPGSALLVALGAAGLGVVAQRGRSARRGRSQSGTT